MRKTKRPPAYKNHKGQLHRIDGPAVEWGDGTKHWYINGKRHRIDGPAIMWRQVDGVYWLYGKYIATKEVNQWKAEMGITNIEFTPEEAALFVLYFGNIS